MSSTNPGKSSRRATTTSSSTQNAPSASTTDLERTHQYLLREIARFRGCYNHLSRLVVEKDAIISSQKAVINAQIQALGNADIRLSNAIMVENEKTSSHIQTIKMVTEELAKYEANTRSAAKDITALTMSLDAERAEVQRLRKRLNELEEVEGEGEGEVKADVKIGEEGRAEGRGKGKGKGKCKGKGKDSGSVTDGTTISAATTTA
ncbi:MAG: hypothetical protein M1840_007346 [Geoglossum simile]|nr:MAG: hypothetical protein M1840_007346 [Geoglossum simile]